MVFGGKLRFFGKFAVASGLLACAGQLGAQPPAPPPDQVAAAPSVRRTLIPDPAVRTGMLPSGLRYRIMRNALPARGLSLRFAVDVGSFEESEAERGFAHFVEHMAFRSTRSAPEGQLEHRFAAAGVAFGKDQNGATGMNATSYRLDFAAADDAAIDIAFVWLRDVADGVVFTEGAVERERGVVLAEAAIRQTPEAAAQKAVMRFQLPGLRSGDRSAEGMVAALTAADAAGLRRFYERWYRPANAIVIVVGDQPVEAMEARIRAAFGSWTSPGPAPPRAPKGRIDGARGTEALTLAVPVLPTLVSACRIGPPRAAGEDEAARARREVIRKLWQAILDNRLQTLVEGGQAGLLGASSTISDEAPEATTACLLAVSKGDLWEQALAATGAELRRFEKDGPTEREMEEAVVHQRGVLRAAISNAAARRSAALADALLADGLDGRTSVSPREAMHAFNVAVEELMPAAIRAQLVRDWPGSGTLVTLISPAPVPREKLRAAWIETEKRPALAAYADADAPEWAYTDFGAPGHVTTREVVADPGFVRLRFANGVVLNFKQTTLESNQVELRARFGAGRRELADKDYVPASLGASLLVPGGLGRMSLAEIKTALKDSGWDLNFEIGIDAFEFASSTGRANLDTQLQVFAAFLSDPGFRPELDDRIGPAVDIIYRVYRSRPELVLSEALTEAIDPDGAERLPPRDTMAAIRMADLARILKPALTRDPIELTIAGDIDEAAAIRLVATTIGALPPRSPDAVVRRPDTHFLRFPERPPLLIRATHEGSADRAMASLVWPLYVATPSRRNEEYALRLLAAIYAQALRHRVRDEMGKSYAPSVVTKMPDDADQGCLIVMIETSPADLDAVLSAARDVAARLAGGTIGDGALDDVRAPMLRDLEATRGRNIWWANAMSGSATNPALPVEMAAYGAMLSAVTMTDVKAAARRWLIAAPIVTIALPRPSKAPRP